ncbi:unnamed protein product, partial [Amoebophrya sp. A25]|eukprot:GSA25T00023490001.1
MSRIKKEDAGLMDQDRTANGILRKAETTVQELAFYFRCFGPVVRVALMPSRDLILAGTSDSDEFVPFAYVTFDHSADAQIVVKHDAMHTIIRGDTE